VPFITGEEAVAACAKHVSHFKPLSASSQGERSLSSAHFDNQSRMEEFKSPLCPLRMCMADELKERSVFLLRALSARSSVHKIVFPFSPLAVDDMSK
jgi:hypothetical protein